MKAALITVALFCLSRVEGSAVLPHPSSCNKFYMCVNDTTYEVVCPMGRYFNYNLRSCEPQATVTCGARSIIDTNPCSNVPQFLPYPSNCSLYYSCTSEGYAYIYNCFNGRYFSALGRYCETPEKSGCTPSNTSTSNNACNDPTGPFTCPTNQGRVPYPLSANMYYDCGQPADSREFICPTSQYFDRGSRDCVTSDRAGCAAQLFVTRNPCNGALPVTSPTNCSEYYSCTVSGRAQKGVCPNMNYFSPAMGQCVAPNPSLCNIGPLTAG